MNFEEFHSRLAAERHALQQEAAARAPRAGGWKLTSRIAVVLSGGGARGAYEAGALLAIQDAQVPTHILAASSVGSINAGSFASHSATLVGEASPLIEAWSEISAAEIGIDWSRYVFMLMGLVAATAGVFNALEDWFRSGGVYLHASRPILTWLALAVAGAALLLLYSELPYIVYVVANSLRGGRWKPDRLKALRSLAANIFVWGFVYLALNFTHLHVGASVMQFEISTKLLVVALMALVALWWFVVRDRLSALSHRFLRLPLRSGLFPNYERAKFLRARIPAEGLRRSPIRVVFTATDLATGAARYFCNRPPAELLEDPGVNRGFISAEMEQAADVIQSIVASSAFTIAYEAVPMQKRLWTDGGLVTNQPIRPAVRLGADILFLLMVDPVSSSTDSAPLRTFLDVGVRALDILVSKNLVADLKLLGRINGLCESVARQFNLRPEEVEVRLADQSYRFVKAFTVSPRTALPMTSLDFDPRLTRAAILEGYRDCRRAIFEFLEYQAQLPAERGRRIIKLAPEKTAAAAQNF